MNELESFLKQALHAHAKPGKVSPASVALIAMNAVEIYSKQKAHLEGEEKKKICLEIIPLVIAESVNENYLTQGQGIELQAACDAVEAFLPSVIDMLAYVSKHPVFIQLKDKAKKHCRC